MEKMQALTETMLEKGKDSSGKWTDDQIRLFNESLKNKGWKDRIVGKEYPITIINQFLNLRDDENLKNARKVVRVPTSRVNAQKKVSSRISQAQPSEMQGVENIRRFVAKAVNEQDVTALVFTIYKLTRENEILKHQLEEERQNRINLNNPDKN